MERSHSYFVVMCDFGQKGLEAIVHPEDTRSAQPEVRKRKEAPHDEHQRQAHRDGGGQ